MICHNVLPLIRDCVDHELEPADIERLKSHFAQCSACAAREQAERELKLVICSKVRSGPAPAGLAGIITREIRKDAGNSNPGSNVRKVSFTRRKIIGMVAAALFFITFSLFMLLRNSDKHFRQPTRLVTGLVDDHIRYLASDKASEMENFNRAEAEKWFANRLDIAVILPRFDEKVLDLLGGRLCYVMDRRVALLFYIRGKQKLSLFVMDANGLEFHSMTPVELAHAECATEVYKGYKVVCWKQEGLLYALVAEDADDGLVELVSRAYQD